MKKILLLLVIVAFGTSAWWFYNQIFGIQLSENVELYVYPTDTVEDLKANLRAENVVIHPFIFEKLADKMNLQNNIHSGYYVLKSGYSTYDILKTLRGGLQTPIQVKINNITFVSDLAGKVAPQLLIDSSIIYKSVNQKYGEKTLCRFIPNTYEMYWSIGVESFTERMEKEYLSFWNKERQDKAAKLNLSPDDVYILASIVEKEYKHAEERKRIAGVYINRLKLGMKLQADPTVKYAIGDLGLRRVLTIHTEYDNPYNTYFYTGLPPGPICMPETSTIDAVLNAEEHQFIYFCAKADLSGYHSFSKTYSEHISNAKLYQKALNNLNIYN